ncbi:MAG TPA: hypothetical protein VK400_04030 [Pyrinomonadaceae bacterium]|nr:hypothetical protein [Pyrinomonadaceae bacterium]
MKINKKIFFSACLITFFCFVFAGAQNGNPPEKSNEPVLNPLTEEEKKLVPKDIIANQPDFTAVESYFSARSISGFSAAGRVARKGKKYRYDTGFVVIISELNKPSLRLNQDKTYEETVGIVKPFISPTTPLNPTNLLGFTDISFTALGTVAVDGDKLLKIQAKSKEFDQEVFLYANLNKKNLITIIQILSPQRSSIQRLQEISFEVPDRLFDISGYRALPKYSWNKVKTAKVFFRGKLVEDALVFRREDYIFIHVAQFEHFFIDLKKQIADTVVFQGLLVAKSGAYIWRTKDDEAISSGDLDGIIEKDCENCVKIQSGTNFLTIPDPDNKSQTLVKVTW